MSRAFAALRRPLGVTALMLHLAFGAAAASLESLTLRRADVTHVERGDAGPCAPAHDEHHCQICQNLTLRAVPPAAAAPCTLPERRLAAADLEPTAPAIRATVGPRHPRAPPTDSV
jgi:hypothetical protein